MNAPSPIQRPAAQAPAIAPALVLVALTSCGRYDRRVDAPPPALTDTAPAQGQADMGAAPPPAPEDEAAEAAPPREDLGPIGVEPAPAPPPPARLPSLSFRAPRPNEAIPKDKADRYLVKLSIADFPMARGGPHVHVVLDDHPYKALSDVRGLIALGDIAPGEPLAEGEHMLVAFPSTADNVSIKPDKGKSPLARVAFWVGKAGKSTLGGATPRVVSSRPKGTYNGAAADRVLLDFYLIDARIGPDAGAVRATLTPSVGEARTVVIADWVPHWITNLPDGDTRVRLELLDAAGAPVPGRWTTTTRVITVNRAAAAAEAAPGVDL